jgi:hypothetical protein
MRSGKPASLRFCQQTSWNALERLAVPMPSICTTMNPRSVSDDSGPGAERLGHERPLRPGVDVSITGYFLRVEVRGRQMMPQMSVLPSRPLATNTSGGDQPLGDSAR